MAKTIDDVWDELQDIKTKLNDLNDLHPIKMKLDELLAKNNILKKCIYCINGLRERSVVTPTGVGADTEFYTCDVCGGDTKIFWGKISTESE